MKRVILSLVAVASLAAGAANADSNIDDLKLQFLKKIQKQKEQIENDTNIRLQEKQKQAQLEENAKNLAKEEEKNNKTIREIMFSNITSAELDNVFVDILNNSNETVALSNLVAIEAYLDTNDVLLLPTENNEKFFGKLLINRMNRANKINDNLVSIIINDELKAILTKDQYAKKMEQLQKSKKRAIIISTTESARDAFLDAVKFIKRDIQINDNDLIQVSNSQKMKKFFIKFAQNDKIETPQTRKIINELKNVLGDDYVYAKKSFDTKYNSARANIELLQLTQYSKQMTELDQVLFHLNVKCAKEAKSFFGGFNDDKYKTCKLEELKRVGLDSSYDVKYDPTLANTQNQPIAWITEKTGPLTMLAHKAFGSDKEWRKIGDGGVGSLHSRKITELNEQAIRLIHDYADNLKK